MSDGISLREFGRMVGVSGEYVRRAVADGKIPAAYIGERTVKGGRVWKVITDPERAAAAWSRNRDPSQVRDKGALADGAKRGWDQRRDGQASRTRAAAPAGKGDRPAPSLPLDRDDDEDVGRDGLPAIATSKRKYEDFRAKTAEMEYLQKVGKLVDAEAVKVGYMAMATEVRNKLLGVPSKAKGKIPHLTIAEVEILEDLISAALKKVATGD